MTDGYNYKGIHIKAEALFNLCYFEHAMVLFHRGTVMFPESDEFQFGVTKCRKTILDGVSKGFRPQYFGRICSFFRHHVGEEIFQLQGPFIWEEEC